MQSLIDDIKTYETAGGRRNDYEHMLLMTNIHSMPIASIITALQYIKQHPICTSYTGSEGVK